MLVFFIEPGNYRNIEAETGANSSETEGRHVGSFVVTNVDPETGLVDICYCVHNEPDTDYFDTVPGNQFGVTSTAKHDIGTVYEVDVSGPDSNVLVSRVFVVEEPHTYGLNSPEALEFAEEVGRKIVTRFSDDDD